MCVCVLVCRVIKNKYSLACLKSMPPEECYERKVNQLKKWLFMHMYMYKYSVYYTYQHICVLLLYS